MPKQQELKRPNGMGCITYLGKNRRKPWAVRVTDGIDKLTGKQTRRYIGYYATETEAKKALAMHYANPAPPKANITMKQLYEEWKEPYFRHISKQTQDNYTSAYSYLAHLENRPFKELRTSDFQRAVDVCQRGQSTKRKIKTFASLLCKYAVQNDIARTNYAEFVRMEKEERKEKEIFSDLEIAAIEKAAKTDKNAQYIMMMIYTGFRITEFLQLTPFQVDIEAQTITGGIKTAAGKGRIVPIHPKIQEYVQAQYDKSSPYFIANDKGKQFSAKYFRENQYADGLRAAGVEYRVPHCTRHTFATILVRANVSPEITKYLMGHTQYAFTIDTYVHNNNLPETRDAISKI